MRTHSLRQKITRLIPCLLVFLVTAGLAADKQADPLSLSDARHLLMRTGFGASPAEISRLTGKSRADAVATIIDGLTNQPASVPPAWTKNTAPLHYHFGDMSTTDRQKFRQTRLAEVQSLRKWWLQEMISTPSPQTERLTLFWHNHFATAYSGLNDQSISVARQHKMLRENSAGNFRDLLKNIIRDPAMLNYLDNNNSKKQKPNENLARELMELFTLGEGSYSEADIKNAAKALTGYSYSETYDMRFIYNIWNHDKDNKTLFGKTGNFNGDDLVDLILQQPAASRFIAAKFWQMLVGDINKSDEVLTKHADAFKDSDFNIKTLYESILLSDAFWQQSNRDTIVKSPVSLTIGAIRSTGILPPDWQTLPGHLRQMGQHLFEPPNVAGWPGGSAWISPGRLLTRLEWLERFESQSNEQQTQAMMGQATMTMADSSQGIGNSSMQQQSSSMMSDSGMSDTGMSGNGSMLTDQTLSIRMASEEFDEQVEYKLRVYGLDNSVWDSGVRKLIGGHDTKRMGQAGPKDLPWQTISFPVKLATADITAIEISFINDGVTPDGADRNLFISRARQGSRVWLPADGKQTGNCPRNQPEQRGNIYCPGTLRMEKSFIPATPNPAPPAANTIRISGAGINFVRSVDEKPHTDLAYTLSDVEFDGRFWNTVLVRYIKHKNGHAIRLNETGCWPECLIEWPECAWEDDAQNRTISLELEKDDQHCMYNGLQPADKKLAQALWMISDDLYKLGGKSNKAERPAIDRNYKQWAPVFRRIQNLLPSSTFYDDSINLEVIPRTIVDSTLGEQLIKPLPAGQTKTERDKSLRQLQQLNAATNLTTLLLQTEPAYDASASKPTLTGILTDLSFQLH